ncbi:UMP-CMP kinase-like [Coccinella septempunctata]|uniref:UMP-CMP kinase-like n=1 Tax=Coccinella septempunctata TaxID=41139 RepID=UPI001D062BC9|nr:UMP-CMP kinase-like [Coccinella septempunctata]XP_044747740.1 UMP-CMP kinase-like [Coccinella septempunctata]XP_044747741.1 UMP-CMP kinase-like [Coccinella septempunctata]
MMSKVMRPKVIFVLGAPGAGKGTQCSKIVSDFNYVHLSAGDLLREERTKPNSQYGKLIDTYLKEGKIVPVAISCGLLKNAMFESHKERFLIDGFPRNQDNVDGWTKDVADHVDLQCVLFFDCPLEECVNRCLKRGAEGSGRSDDNEESLRKRIETYLSQTSPIIQHYNMLKLVHTIDASKDPDKVYEDVKKVMSKYI